jgi:TPR repeat protein
MHPKRALDGPARPRVKHRLLRAILVGSVTMLSVSPLHADFKAAVKDYNDGRYEQAKSEFLTLAALGDAPSQFNLGAMALQGQAGPKDPGSGVGWLQAAVENGSREITDEKLAQLNSQLTDTQRETAADVLKHYGRAAIAQTVLPMPAGNLCPDVTQPRRLNYISGQYPWKDARHSKNGFVILQLTVGTDGIPRDPEVLMTMPGEDFVEPAMQVWMQARFEPAQRAGQPVESRLMFKVDYKMIEGGTLWDYGELKALREQAIAGDPDAEYQIGLAATLDSSLGIPRQQGLRQLVLAAKGGVPRAQYWVAMSYIRQAGCQKVEKSVPWLRAAAAAGNGSAQVTLARGLLQGEPGPAQIAEAKALLEQAAHTDDVYVAKHVIALLAASPLPELRDPAGAALAATHLGKPAFEIDPQVFEAIAAAHAAKGEFYEAVSAQQRALHKAEVLHWSGTAAMQERYDSYRQGRPWTGDLFAVR